MSSNKNGLEINEQEYDTIIVGSGMGGLGAGICLARAGQKVLILEQHDVPGGWCHSFYLNGFRFTPGVHYVGNVGPGESTSELYEGLGIAKDIVFFQMNKDAYEHCWVNGEKIHFPSNLDDLIVSLGERFPKEKKNIKKYLKLVEQVAYELFLIPKMNGFWDNITIPWRTRHMGKYGLFSLRRVIDWHIKDPLLKQILNVQCGDHGLPPKQASFPLHCALMSHYFKGGYYPLGGGGAIVKAMTNALKGHGGELLTKTSVDRILLEGEDKKRATGVLLKDGRTIKAKRVISNADPGITYNQLVGVENLSTKLRERLLKTKYSVTSLMLFLTVNMDVKKAGLDSGNIWVMPNASMDVFFEDMMSSDLSDESMFPSAFVSCTTLKDPPSYDGRHHTLEVITFISYDAFREFEHEKNPRSEKYLRFKEHLSQRLIKTVEMVVPGISNHIVQRELGTPITNDYYINSTEGSVYGTAKTFKQTGPFSYKPRTEIENLYLCGASIMAHGVAGSAYSGVQTAAIILGCRQEDLIKPDPENTVEVYDAEDDSQYPDWLKHKIALRKTKADLNARKFLKEKSLETSS